MAPVLPAGLVIVTTTLLGPLVLGITLAGTGTSVTGIVIVTLALGLVPIPGPGGTGAGDLSNGRLVMSFGGGTGTGAGPVTNGPVGGLGGTGIGVGVVTGIMYLLCAVFNTYLEKYSTTKPNT
jgi:hypothetical protein